MKQLLLGNERKLSATPMSTSQAATGWNYMTVKELHMNTFRNHLVHSGRKSTASAPSLNSKTSYANTFPVPMLIRVFEDKNWSGGHVKKFKLTPTSLSTMTMLNKFGFSSLNFDQSLRNLNRRIKNYPIIKCSIS